MYIWLHEETWFGTYYETKREAIDGAREWFMGEWDTGHSSMTTYFVKVGIYEVLDAEALKVTDPYSFSVDVESESVKWVEDVYLKIDPPVLECSKEIPLPCNWQLDKEEKVKRGEKGEVFLVQNLSCEECGRGLCMDGGGLNPETGERGVLYITINQ